MEPHERIEWQSKVVDATLTSLNGTKINIRNCHLQLTNRYIRILAQPKVTYTVIGKGDRNFEAAKVLLTAAKPHRFIQPWFGPYQWETRINMSEFNELEPKNDQWTLNLTFSSGGAFEYRQAFLRLYSDARQAAQDGMDEVLPAYSE